MRIQKIVTIIFRRARPMLVSFWVKRYATKLRVQKKLVLQLPYGGLGDALFHSHLPRLAKESGIYNNVFISRRSVSRDSSFSRLVWEKNPFVDGFTNEPGLTVEEMMFLRRNALKKTVSPNANLLDRVMIAFDLDDGFRFHEPEVYYKPKFLPEYAHQNLYDPNWVSNKGNITAEAISAYMKENGIKIDAQFASRKNALLLNEVSDKIETTSLENFCDILFSCKQVYCLVTGTATLVPALGRSATVFYDEKVGPSFLHSNSNKYIKLD